MKLYKYIGSYIERDSSELVVIVQDDYGNHKIRKKEVIEALEKEQIKFTNARYHKDRLIEDLGDEYEDAYKKYLSAMILDSSITMDKHDDAYENVMTDNTIMIYSCVNNVNCSIRAGSLIIEGIKDKHDRNDRFILKTEKKQPQRPIINGDDTVIKNRVQSEIRLRGKNLLVKGDLRVCADLEFKKITVTGSMSIYTSSRNGARVECSMLDVDCHADTYLTKLAISQASCIKNLFLVTFRNVRIGKKFVPDLFKLICDYFESSKACTRIKSEHVVVEGFLNNPESHITCENGVYEEIYRLLRQKLRLMCHMDTSGEGQADFVELCDIFSKLFDDEEYIRKVKGIIFEDTIQII